MEREIATRKQQMQTVEKETKHINKCSKLVKKEYKNRHDQVGKAVHVKSCKQLHLEYLDKWYKQKSAAELENQSHKILRAVDIQINPSKQEEQML